MTEDQAVQRCQDGDKDAFRHLVDLYKDVLYGTAYLMTSDRSVAEEQVQEAFLSAWQGIQGFRRGRPFKPWLVRILVNGVLAHQRKRRLETAPLDEANGPGESIDPFQEVEKLDDRRAVRRALVGLSDSHRQVIILRYFADLTVPEVARAIGTREGTVKSRIHRALGQLRDRLSDVRAGEVVGHAEP